MKTHSEKFLKQRRFYMILPLLVLPFLVMIFWALGGGQTTPVSAKEFHSGLNLSLPDAHFPKENEAWNKLNYYEQAEKDSIKYKKARENDPYYSVTALEPQANEKAIEKPEVPQETQPSAGLNSSIEESAQKDPIEEKVNAKLQQLYQQINQPEQEQPNTKADAVIPQVNDETFSEDVARLEKMMEMMHQEKETDPEMQQIQSVLDKILDIQHPERAKEKVRQQSLAHQKQVFPVEASETTNSISLFGSNTALNVGAEKTANDVGTIHEQELSNGFFGLAEEIEEVQPDNHVIQAIIHDTQELMAGAEVKMRLLQDVYINGKLIPKDEMVFGTCAVNGDRFTISVNCIALLPVSLKVYDLKGMEGIYISGSMTQQAVSQGSNQAIQDLQVYDGLDASIGTQMANAGVQAAKGLFAKKIRAVKGTVKAGYRIVLKNANSHS